RDDGNLPAPLSDRTTRGASDAHPGRNILRGMGRASNLSARTDLDVARGARLPGHDNEIAKLGRARDAGLSHDHTVPPDDDVVPDLHQIINFSPFADNCIL